MEAQPTSVVGGSLVGLSAAVSLTWRGVPTVLVERHPDSSSHPRAIGFTPRKMELFRAVGLGGRIPQVPPGTRRRRAGCASRAWPGNGSKKPPGRPRSGSRPASSTRPAGERRSHRTA
jgi:putative polyketide hydroxylase